MKTPAQLNDQVKRVIGRLRQREREWMTTTEHMALIVAQRAQDAATLAELTAKPLAMLRAILVDLQGEVGGALTPAAQLVNGNLVLVFTPSDGRRPARFEIAEAELDAPIESLTGDMRAQMHKAGYPTLED